MKPRQDAMYNDDDGDLSRWPLVHVMMSRDFLRSAIWVRQCTHLSEIRKDVQAAGGD